ncbi:hypothetical protein QBC36DRAFT_390741 [Triangularia setosa]|uniref:Pentatricopeptide repeat protein n=1 Tax=Triangularia setosa TaxID=2587417 RepID=A0AAN7A1N4_9PEZI|nr:hypothetical protein QBC36DRAFT_390741 [Podospora setosa]
MILRAGLVGRSCLARACQHRSQTPIIHPLLPPPPISKTSRLLRSPQPQLLAQSARDAPFTTTARFSFPNDDSDTVPPWPEDQKEGKRLGKVSSHMSPDEIEETTPCPSSHNEHDYPSEETTKGTLPLGPEEAERDHASTNDSSMGSEATNGLSANGVDNSAISSHTLDDASRDNRRGGRLAWGPGRRGNWLDAWERRFRPLYRALNSGRSYSRALAEVPDFPQWGETEMLFSAAEIEMEEFQERYCGYGNVDKYLTKWMNSMLYLLRYDTGMAHKFLRATYEGTLTPRWAVNDTVEFLIAHELAENRTLYTLEFTQHTLFLLTKDMEAEALWGLYWELVQYARRLSRDPRYKSNALDMLEEAITSGELHGDAPLTMMLSTCILDFQDQLGQLRRELTTRLLNLITPNKYTYSVMGAWTIYQIMIDQGIEPEQYIFSNLLNVAKHTKTIEPLVPEALKSRYIWNDIIDCVLDESQRNAHAMLTFRVLLLDLQALIPIRLGPPYETAEQVFKTATTEMDITFLRKIDRILERLPERVERPAVPGSDAISIMLRGYARAVWKAGDVINFYKLFRAKLMQGQYIDSRIPKWNNDSRRSAGFGILEDMIEVLKKEAEEELLAKRTANSLPADDDSIRTLGSVLPAQGDTLHPEEESLPTEELDHLSTEEGDYLPAEEEQLPAEEEDLPPPKNDPPLAQGELRPTVEREPLPTTTQQQQQQEPREPLSSEEPQQQQPPPPPPPPLLNPGPLNPLHPAPRPGAGWPSLKAQQAQWLSFHRDETYLYSMSPAPTIYTFNVLLSGVVRASRSLTSAKSCIKQAEDWFRYLGEHGLEPNYHTWSILVRNWARQQRPGAVAWAMKKMEEAGFKANEKMMEELELLRDKERAWRELERLMDGDLQRKKRLMGDGEREDGKVEEGERKRGGGKKATF